MFPVSCYTPATPMDQATIICWQPFLQQHRGDGAAPLIFSGTALPVESSKSDFSPSAGQLETSCS